MKAYWINAAEKEITEVACNGLADLQRLAGGYIEIAKEWSTGDILFVDEDSLAKSPRAFFRLAGKDTPIGGNGVLTGPEVDDDSGDLLAPVMALNMLRAEITFLTPEQVESWAKGNSSEPVITVFFTGEAPEVIARVGDVFGHKPPKAKL